MGVSQRSCGGLRPADSRALKSTHTCGHHGPFRYIHTWEEAEFLPQWVGKENLVLYTVGHRWHRDAVLCKISQPQEKTKAVWFYLHWLLEQQIQTQTAGCWEAASGDEGWGVLVGEGLQFRR